MRGMGSTLQLGDGVNPSARCSWQAGRAGQQRAV